MKNIILTIFIIVLSASQGSALELPKGETCTSIFWKSITNSPKDRLSDHQECVLATVWPDKKSGSFGGFFWILDNDKYYSVSYVALNVLPQEDRKAAAYLDLRRQVIEYNKGKK